MAEQPSAPRTSRKAFESAVAEKAAGDPGFKQQLLKDPKAALKAAFGVEIPAGIELAVVEETPTRFYLVLPSAVEELSDADLEQAAGGLSLGLASSHKDMVGLQGFKLQTAALKFFGQFHK